jgi:hypothetical protein
METKSIAANAENNVETKTGCVKFISTFRQFHFDIKKLDEKGEQIFHVNPNSNHKLFEFKHFEFVPVSGHKGKDGKIDPNTAFCFFIVDPEKHGKDFPAIISKLQEFCKNPMYRMFTEDDHFKHRNPEAFRIAKEKSELESTISDKDKRIAELEERLGFKKR